MNAVSGADDLAARVARLSPEQKALLARRLAGEQRPGVAQRIPRRGAGAEVPLTFAQWRLWFLEQFTPGTNAWNTPVAVALDGPLDLGALSGALSAIVARHATLRTTYVAARGIPSPVLADAARVDVGVVQAAGRSEQERDDEVARFVAEEVRRPFDLASDLMLRARVLALEPQRHVLALVIHHIACDGWSKGLLLDELGRAYDALVGGEPPELPELSIEYADFAVWQRERLRGERLERLMTYWRERLAGHAPALELPTDRPRPRTPSFRGAVEWVRVPGRLARATTAVGREEGATAFMTLLAAFKALLHAHSGQTDILVGSPAAMRDRPELERLIGFFANTLVYRTDLSGDPSFRELLRRVRDTALGVYGHQELPFEKVVEAVRPPRDPSRNPLVQVNMRVEGREPEVLLSGLRATPLALDPGIARFDLAIELGLTDDGYAGYLEYDAALFDAATATGFARDFEAVLEAAVAAPDLPLSELDPIRHIHAARAGREVM